LAWKVKFSERASRELDRLDSVVQRPITNFLKQRLATLADPRQRGAALTGKLKGLWRYRVADYRILCRIEDGELLILVVAVGHRRNIYDS
jgi:mRNA interferase RelE/StbE